MRKIIMLFVGLLVLTFSSCTPERLQFPKQVCGDVLYVYPTCNGVKLLTDIGERTYIINDENFDPFYNLWKKGFYRNAHLCFNAIGEKQ